MEELEVRRMRDRDLERRSECDVGRELMSGASSKASCTKRSASADAMSVQRGLHASLLTSSAPELLLLLLSGLVGRSSIAGGDWRC